MTAVVLASPALSWPTFVVGLVFLVVAWIVMRSDVPPRRVAGAGVFAVVLGVGPFVVPIDAASVGSGICAWMPWLLECWLF